MEGNKCQDKGSIEESDNGKEQENESDVDIQLEEQENDSAAASKRPKVQRRRDQENRRSVTNKFKAKVIAAVESGEEAISMADLFKVLRFSMTRVERKDHKSSC